MNSAARQNAMDLDFSVNAGYVIFMPLVSASGKVWATAVVLRGACQKYRIMVSGRFETPQRYFPFNSSVAYRSPSSMTMEIFHQFAERFIVETAEIRSRCKCILWFWMDSVDMEIIAPYIYRERIGFLCLHYQHTQVTGNKFLGLFRLFTI